MPTAAPLRVDRVSACLFFCKHRMPCGAINLNFPSFPLVHCEYTFIRSLLLALARARAGML